MLFVSFTGVLLNHVDHLGWNEKRIGSSWLLDRYGMGLKGAPVSFEAAGSLVSEWGGQLFWNGRALGAEGDLRGAVGLSAGVAAVSGRAVHLYDAKGELIEVLGEASLPAGSFEKAGLNSEGRLVLQTGEGRDWAFSEDLLAYGPSADPALRWSEPVPTTELARKAMRKDYRGEGLAWSRVVLDLHSGRFFGPAGRWIIDASVGLLILLALTGVVLGVRALRQGSSGRLEQE